MSPIHLKWESSDTQTLAAVLSSLSEWTQFKAKELPSAEKMLSLGKQGVILAKEEEDGVSGNGNNWHKVSDKHTHLSRRWGTSFKYVYQSLSLSVCVENPVGNKKKVANRRSGKGGGKPIKAKAKRYPTGTLFICWFWFLFQHGCSNDRQIHTKCFHFCFIFFFFFLPLTYIYHIAINRKSVTTNPYTSFC